MNVNRIPEPTPVLTSDTHTQQQRSPQFAASTPNGGSHPLTAQTPDSFALPAARTSSATDTAFMRSRDVVVQSETTSPFLGAQAAPAHPPSSRERRTRNGRESGEPCDAALIDVSPPRDRPLSGEWEMTSRNASSHPPRSRAGSLGDSIACDGDAGKARLSGGTGVDSDEPSDPEKLSPLRRLLLRIDPFYGTLMKWSLSLLLLLFLVFIVFGILYSGIAYRKSDSGGGLTSRCDTAFDAILGGHDGVFGYSNCNDEFISDVGAYLPIYTHVPAGGLDTAPLYTGMKWQCVEYARRYWVLRGTPEPAYFGDIPGASDIWDLTTVTTVLDSKKQLPLRRYPNGEGVMNGGRAPQVGDIIIYAKDDAAGFPYGHVAVIVDVTGSAVLVAEQNWSSDVWPEPFRNYSRSIPLQYDAVKLAYTINDPHGTVLGWMNYG